jgi:hypothetical protein
MKLFGYSVSLNVLILIGILYLIMIVNALSSSCNKEGLKTVIKESKTPAESAQATEKYNTAKKWAREKKAEAAVAQAEEAAALAEITT